MNQEPNPVSISPQISVPSQGRPNPLPTLLWMNHSTLLILSFPLTHAHPYSSSMLIILPRADPASLPTHPKTPPNQLQFQSHFYPTKPKPTTKTKNSDHPAPAPAQSSRSINTSTLYELPERRHVECSLFSVCRCNLHRGTQKL